MLKTPISAQMWRLCSLLLLLSFTILPCWCRMEPLPTEDPCDKPDCYHRPETDCPAATDICRCKVDAICKTAVICCDVDASGLSDGLACANVNRINISSIHIRNATLSTLNLSDYTTWRGLVSMAFTDGNITNIVGKFVKFASTSCLNFSSNGINRIEDRALANLYNLRELDLSNNNLTDVPHFKKEGIVSLDISDNKPMLCTSLNDTIRRSDIQFNNRNRTWCLSSKTFDWFNSTELVPLEQIERVNELRKDCTINCTCQPLRFDIVPGKSPIINVYVSCTSQHLTELPSPLPPNTKALNVSFNNITSLQPVSKDPSYQSLSELYADHNEITSILPLEGSKFITNFVALSLSHNKLEKIETYVLTNIFDRNYNSRRVNLGHNKLLCDCNTAKVLKVWLMTKQKHIPDYDQIDCENMDMKVSDLDPSKLCQSQHDWTDYIYYIIATEVLLLVFLIAKVSYDYWIFKTAGYLPWPASKMPKLPCDWLCE
ncbi:PREDICTED: protein halfway [Nicrophorus vespilloides]|uniref:Protein halfway n=1 Tax=Nicrophorus vespilloides TaxID=110193 RepID=A0ABM1MZX3_NICVS|nr:PREDICTED: protein halfway [Nicrophorus vespilloides]